MKTTEIDFFNRIAPKWDSMEVLSLPPRINNILDLLPLREGMSVLDLGTGTGVLIPYLLERVGKTGTVLGVDISRGMLDIAHEKCDSLAPYPLFLKSDFEEESVPGVYDVILLYSVFPHLERPVETLNKLIRENLSPEGSIYIIFPTNEDFINNIHSEVKVKSKLLPSAPQLAERLRQSGLNASCLVATKDIYLVSVTR